MTISSVRELNMQVKEEAIFIQDLLAEVNKVMVGQEALVERVLIALLATGAPLGATVLKAGHHGSNTSSTAAFLDAVQPTFAVVSVGENNRYHLPHPDLLPQRPRALARGPSFPAAFPAAAPLPRMPTFSLSRIPL